MCTSCSMYLTMKHFLTECRGNNPPLTGSNQDKLEDEESVKKVIDYVKRTKVDIWKKKVNKKNKNKQPIEETQ